MTLSRLRGCLPLVGTALFLAMPASALANAMPGALAEMAGTLWSNIEGKLPSDDADTPNARAAIARAEKIFKDMRIRVFPKTPPSVPDAGPRLAKAFGLDWESPTARREIARLLAMPADEAEKRLSKSLEGDVLSNAVAELSRIKGADAAKTSWSQKMETGEVVTVTWRPETNRFDMEVYDGSEGERFQTLVSARVDTTLDEETGALTTALRLDDNPVAVLTEADFIEISRSIWGEWTDTSGWIWTIAPRDENDREAGDVAPTPAELGDEIARLKARRTEIENAKEFVWFDPSTDQVVRQESFRRLPEPWEFRGEQPLIADAADQIAALTSRIEELERSLSGADQLPVEANDPIAYDDSVEQGALSVSLLTTLPDGHSYDWPDATFDGRTLRARRTATDVRDSFDPVLPAGIVAELVASWSPPTWIIVDAKIDAASRKLTLEGEYWGLHVTYSGGFMGMGSPSVSSIHTPFATALNMSSDGETVAYKSDWGAADSAFP